MNKQSGPGSIEWTQWTWAPITGCKHGCQWNMPQGENAICYAKQMVDTMPSLKPYYPNGSGHHYFFPQRLREPLTVKAPSRIFVDAMSDICGGWIPQADVLKVMDVMRQAHWHTFQALTKAPHRVHLLDWPKNVWVGVSSPPDVWNNRNTASERVKRLYLQNTAQNLATVKAKGNTVWMSVEPLSFDITPTLLETGLMGTLDWIVIGAASRGKIKAQPRKQWVINLVLAADICGIPVFMKGNLRNNKAITETAIGWREDFPKAKAVRALEEEVTQERLI
jgi:protein gp37